MDKKTATDFVERIEAHHRAEEAIWQEMLEHPDYEMHEDKIIRSVIKARAGAREQLDQAEADLGSFDWVDDGEGGLAPREEVAA